MKPNYNSIFLPEAADDSAVTASYRPLLAEALSAYVGPGRQWTSDVLDAELDLQPGTIEAFIREQATPDMAVLWRMIGGLPVEFLAMLLLPLGIGGVARLDCNRSAAMTLDGRVAELAALTGLHLSNTEFAAPVSPGQVAVIRALSQRCGKFLTSYDLRTPKEGDAR
jgi:hypothetical protein